MKKGLMVVIIIACVLIAFVVIRAIVYGGELTGEFAWEGWKGCTTADPCKPGLGDCDPNQGVSFIDASDGRWAESDDCKTGWCREDIFGERDFCDCRSGTVWDGTSCVE